MSNHDTSLCAKCGESMYITVMGICMWCENPTASASYKLCFSCAASDGICQVCLGEC